MSCCGTMEQVSATEGTLNTLNFNKKKKPVSAIKMKMNAVSMFSVNCFSYQINNTYVHVISL